MRISFHSVRNGIKTLFIFYAISVTLFLPQIQMKTIDFGITWLESLSIQGQQMAAIITVSYEIVIQVLPIGIYLMMLK